MALVTDTPQTNGHGLANDVAKIRDILFGEQANQMDERIISLEAAVNSLRQENTRLRQALEAEVTSRSQADKTLSQANKTLVESISKEKSFVTATFADTSKQFDKKLAEQAKTQQTQVNNLIGKLASHLVAQQAEHSKQIASLQAVLQNSQQAQELLASKLLESLDKAD